jgi:hypothetical protein
MTTIQGNSHIHHAHFQITSKTSQVNSGQMEKLEALAKLCGYQNIETSGNCCCAQAGKKKIEQLLQNPIFKAIAEKLVGGKINLDGNNDGKFTVTKKQAKLVHHCHHPKRKKSGGLFGGIKKALSKATSGLKKLGGGFLKGLLGGGGAQKILSGLIGKALPMVGAAIGGPIGMLAGNLIGGLLGGGGAAGGAGGLLGGGMDIFKQLQDLLGGIGGAGGSQGTSGAGGAQETSGAGGTEGSQGASGASPNFDSMSIDDVLYFIMDQVAKTLDKEIKDTAGKMQSQSDAKNKSGASKDTKDKAGDEMEKLTRELDKLQKLKANIMGALNAVVKSQDTMVKGILQKM